MREKLPFLWNAHWSSFVVVGLIAGALIAQIHPQVDFGEPEWTIIGLAAGKLLDIAAKITNYYTGGGE